MMLISTGRLATVTLLFLILMVIVVSGTTNPDPSRARTDLGAALFMDRRLSRNGTQACGSCHQPARAFTDGRSTAIGSTGEVGYLNTPTLLDVSELPALGWARPDLTQLERQIPIPLFGSHPVEMGATGHEAAILGRLQSDASYPALFWAAFPGDPDPIRWDRVIDALAAYVRSLRSAPSPYDRFLAGDEAALSDEARRGARLFVEIGCSACHSGPLLTNGSYHNLGLYGFTGLGDVPPGQEGLYRVTGQARDLGRWRVPSLRNVILTAPYFHDGSAATLDEVLEVYAQGGRGAGQHSPLKSRAIVPIVLGERDRTDLIGFLASLTSEE